MATLLRSCLPPSHVITLLILISLPARVENPSAIKVHHLGLHVLPRHSILPQIDRLDRFLPRLIRVQNAHLHLALVLLRHDILDLLFLDLEFNPVALFGGDRDPVYAVIWLGQRGLVVLLAFLLDILEILPIVLVGLPSVP